MSLIQRNLAAAMTKLRPVQFVFHGLLFLCASLLFFLIFLSGPAVDAIFTNLADITDGEYPVTAHPIAASSQDVAYLGGKGEGLSCSLPTLARWLVFKRNHGDAIVDLQFRQACAFHDYCYRHGYATYGYSQTDCDYILQEHAFRLCRYISPERSKTECQRRARLVLVGVRIGAASSFQMARSTYFEFDPYPVKARDYQIFRIADSPASWVAAGALPKSLYVFSIRPSGMKVKIVGWGNSHTQEFCRAFEIGGRFGYMLTAPNVLKSTRGRDWFVWWQRESLTSTSGRFAIVIPAVANSGEWNHIGAVNSLPNESECNRKDATDKNIRTPVAVSAGVAKSPFGRTTDRNFSEFHGYNWPQPSPYEQVQIYSLRTLSCQSAATAHCFLHMVIALKDNRIVLEDRFREEVDPYYARTGEVGKSKNGDLPRERDRYRSFVLPPFAANNDGKPVILFSRRGESDGSGFDSSTVIRRFGVAEFLRQSKSGSMRTVRSGQSAGKVDLLGHSQSDDPFIPLNTQDANAVSVMSLKKAAPGLKLSVWHLPALKLVTPYSEALMEETAGRSKAGFIYLTARPSAKGGAARAELRPMDTPPILMNAQRAIDETGRDRSQIFFWAYNIKSQKIEISTLDGVMGLTAIKSLNRTYALSNLKTFESAKKVLSPDTIFIGRLTKEDSPFLVSIRLGDPESSTIQIMK